MGLKLLHIYQSPWSERVRWALELKGLPYDKEEYQIGAGEEDLKRRTGQAQVPVLTVDGTVIPDSTAILDWLEREKPAPALLPRTDRERAWVGAWEELMDWALGPQGRFLILGRLLRSGDAGIRQIGERLGTKYQYTPYAESHAREAVGRLLTILKHSLEGRSYLVGDAFTRADLTTAAMLAVVNPAPDDLFLFPAPLRPMFTEPSAQDAVFAPIFQWRDGIYRRHRGGPVKP